MVKYARLFKWGTSIGIVLGLCVVMLGAFVRLADAGLGCPDWPGCYGHIIGVPQTSSEIAVANMQYPQRAFEEDKAWLEMLHRYLASVLGLIIMILAGIAWINRHNNRRVAVLTFSLLALVIFQGLLGMWTVTLQLNPLIVLAHLLGGFGVLALLWWLILQTQSSFPAWPIKTGTRLLVRLAFVLVVAQIILGGWTSANYAALACTDFPKCQQQYWPDMDFSSLVIPSMFASGNYEFGILDSEARTAIHVLHRIGALLVLIFLLGFFYFLWRQNPPAVIVNTIWLSAVCLAVQIALGISNVVFSLPIAIATSHNGVAALLLLCLLTLVFQVNQATKTNDA